MQWTGSGRTDTFVNITASLPECTGFLLVLAKKYHSFLPALYPTLYALCSLLYALCFMLYSGSLRYISRRQLKPPRSTTSRYLNWSDRSSGSVREGLANMSRPPGFSTPRATLKSSRTKACRSGTRTRLPMGGLVMMSVTLLGPRPALV